MAKRNLAELKIPATSDFIPVAKRVATTLGGQLGFSLVDLDELTIALTQACDSAIAAANEPPAYPGIPGHEPNVAQGRQEARAVAAAMAPLKALAEQPASYVSETDYFQDDWQTAFWGDHYARLKQVKDRYDPGGLFVVHHGVGTET